MGCDYMNQILARTLTMIGVLLLFNWVMKANLKELKANLKKDHVIVHLPLVFRWVGLAGVVLFSLFILLIHCFPSANML